MKPVRITYLDKNDEDKIGCFLETDSGYWKISIGEKHDFKKIKKKEEIYEVKGELKFRLFQTF